ELGKLSESEIASGRRRSATKPTPEKPAFLQVCRPRRRISLPEASVAAAPATNPCNALNRIEFRRKDSLPDRQRNQQRIARLYHAESPTLQGGIRLLQYHREIIALDGGAYASNLALALLGAAGCVALD